MERRERGIALQWIAIDCVAIDRIAIDCLAIDWIAIDSIEIDWIAGEGEEGGWEGEGRERREGESGIASPSPAIQSISIEPTATQSIA